MAGPDPNTQGRAVYVISVAAELAGVHPQTLRTYERKGLLHPFRTAGNVRRYSEEDIAKLWGGNLLRVMADAERVSVELRGQR